MLEKQPCALMLLSVLWSPFSLHCFSLFVSLFLSPKLPEVNNVAFIKQGLIVKNINILKEYWEIYNLKGKAIVSSGEGRGKNQTECKTYKENNSDFLFTIYVVSSCYLHIR